MQLFSDDNVMQLQTIKAFLLVFFLGGAAARNEPSDVDESIAYLSKSIADSQVSHCQAYNQSIW